MKIALDLGTRTGWACSTVTPAGYSMLSGHVDLRPGKHANWASRFVAFTDHLDKLNVLENAEGVWYEEVRRHSGVDAAHVYGGFLSHLGVWCESNGLPMIGVPVGTIKKFATGNGNASKDMMIVACEQKWGVITADDNEADAVALLKLVESGAL